MKRILIAMIALLAALSFSSCAKDEDTRTYHFYKDIDQSSFWYACKITEGDETYRYAQARTDKVITTIEDHDNDEDDGYAIYELEDKELHSLNFGTEKYNTLVTENGLKFLFDENEAIQFRAPDESEEEAEFDGKTYYCEIFEAVDANGDEVGLNKYYFDGMTLVAIEWIENDEVVKTLVLTEYSNTIPNSVHTSIPEGFKGGTLTHEQIINPRPSAGN